MAQANLTNSNALSIIEDYCTHKPTAIQKIEAWAYIIRTGYCYELGGFFGREAEQFIQDGIISDDGVIL